MYRTTVHVHLEDEAEQYMTGVPAVSVIVKSKHSSAAEERVVHVDVTGIIVSVGVPQTS